MRGDTATARRSVSWDDSKKKRRAVALMVGALLLSVPVAHAGAPAPSPAGPLTSVIIQVAPGEQTDVLDAIGQAGGSVERELDLIDGYAVDLPTTAVDALRAHVGVQAITNDVAVQLHSTDDGYSPSSDPGSMASTDRIVGARAMWAKGYTGRGVDVALIDSGVVPVNGLTAAGKVVDGPDLSSDADSDQRRHLDAFGHGTHMAGVIAGRDDAVASPDARRNADNFVGVAPDARVVNIKVADANGATSLSRVIGGIDWAVRHRNDDGLAIRVLNLSFGTDAISGYSGDPLARAVERAWDTGLVVVVAAGNRGSAANGLDSPAYDPRVIAVGGDETYGTATADDDTIPTWSSSGDGVRNPDVVAPGKSIVSLRDPGSYIDQQFPGGRVATRFFRGSGTSPATAVVSGAAALLLQQRPSLTPDQVKSLLTSTATSLPGVDRRLQGAGLVDLRSAMVASVPDGGGSSADDSQSPPSIADDGTWEPSDTVDAWTGNSWSGNSWSGNSWSGNSWSGNSWSMAGSGG